jgi:hypothetical protein
VKVVSFWSSSTPGLANLVLTGDILNFIYQKCRESRLQYPGGTGRTEERIRTYSFYVRLLGEAA